MLALDSNILRAGVACDLPISGSDDADLPWAYTIHTMPDRIMGISYTPPGNSKARDGDGRRERHAYGPPLSCHNSVLKV